MTSVIRYCFGIVLLFFPLLTQAAAPTWKIIPQESKLTFTGTLNDVPTSGQFKSFSGTINFDPNKLNESHVHIVVDTDSVSTSYADIAITIKTSDWLDAKYFPQATFDANHFTKTGDNTYQTNGKLTIRDKTHTIPVTFVAKNSAPNKVQIKGRAILKRTQFGVGKGEWASTDSVADDVKVDFVITAIKSQ